MNVTCPLCGSGEAAAAFTKKDYPHFECQCCKALYVSPRPRADEIAEFYRHRDQDIMSNLCWSDTADSHRHSWEIWREVLKLVGELAGRGPLLDMGCGTGQFLAFARSQGWSELVGVEVVPEVAQIARKLTGAEIHVSDITNINLPAQFFAGVILWDVIEHVTDVQQILTAAHHVLRGGGVLVIGTVNRRGVSLRLLKERALTVTPPEHLTYPTRDGLSRVVEKVGLEIRGCWSCSVFLREWARFLPRIHRAQDSQDVDYARWRSKATESKSFLAVIRVANAFLKMTHLGDELVAVAQKPRENELRL